MVLEASGHVERFTDFMVRDAVTKDCHRADHLLEHALEAAIKDAVKSGLSPEKVKVGRRQPVAGMGTRGPATRLIIELMTDPQGSWPSDSREQRINTVRGVDARPPVTE